MKTLILLLLTCSTIQAQQINPYWEPAPVENYITGAMLIGTFIAVDLSQPYVTVQQRNTIAYSCMATTFVTYVTIRHFRLKKSQKNNLKRLGY
jgi:hypothetical protein